MTKPPQAAADPVRAPQKKPLTALAAAIGIAGAAILAPFVSGWESGGQQHLVPYLDIVGVWTQCDGETLGVTARSPKETPEGCAVKLDKRLAGFAQAVAACSPGLRGHDYQWSAATSLAYNIGTTAYCGSTVDRRFDAGQWAAACDAFLMWNKAGGKVVAGLANRRRAERALCLTGLPK
ncbi:lysozyme [Sphingomonas sp. RB3P16]|uniref:lysozyme n=1 Tax=Parasphingomonas frigoris TaxID=3096163 RepID=UPI002FCB9766